VSSSSESDEDELLALRFEIISAFCLLSGLIIGFLITSFFLSKINKDIKILPRVINKTVKLVLVVEV